MSKPGIRLTVGGRNFDSVDSGFGEWQKNLGKIQRKMGDLTRPFDIISSELIHRIKRRFDDNTFGKSPFEGRTSGFTRLVRAARGGDPNGPKLNDTGFLKDSIHRLASPTKTASGGQREVLTLRLGTLGVRYAEDHLAGNEWNIPVFVSPGGSKFINYDEMSGMFSTNAEIYGDRWALIQTYPRGVHTIDVPARNFLALFREDEEFIDATVKDFLSNLMDN